MWYNKTMEFSEIGEEEFRRTRFASENFTEYRNVSAVSKTREGSVSCRSEGKGADFGLWASSGAKMAVRTENFSGCGGWLMDYKGKRRKEILAFLSERAENFCRERGGMVLMISPNIISQSRDIDNNVIEGEDNREIKGELAGLGYKYLGEYEQVKWTFVLNLVGKTSEELFKGLRMTHRRLIRRAEREGIRVRELGEDELGIMKDNAAEAGARHGFQDPEMAYYRSMKEYFGEKVKFMAAEVQINGEYIVVATGMFVLYGKELIYLYGGSMTKYQKYNGSYLLQWKMIEEALKLGCERYNFYGVRR